MQRCTGEGVQRRGGRGNAGYHPARIGLRAPGSSPRTYVDAGLATHNLGSRAPALPAEALELAPYRKFLYASDAFGLPELYDLGAALFHRAIRLPRRRPAGRSLYRTNRSAPDQDVLRRKRQTC